MKVFINSSPDNQLQKYSIYKNSIGFYDCWRELQTNIGRKRIEFLQFRQQNNTI